MGIWNRIGAWLGGVGRGAFALSLATPAPAPAARPSERTGPARPDLRRLASVGTQISGGRVLGKEQNTELTGRYWPPVAEEMTRTDPMLMAVERALIGTQLTATWKFTVRDDAPPLAIEARDQLNANFGFAGARGRLSGGWEGVLSQALLYQGLGYRYMEPVYFVEGGRVWADILDCEPSAHYRWEVDAYGELARVHQLVPGGDYGGLWQPSVPAEKILLFTNARTGANFEGCGLKRPCWAPWLLKKHTHDQIGIGVERWANGTPWIKHDLKRITEQGYQPKQLAQMLEAAKATAKAYLSHENAYLISPVGIDFDVFAQGVLDVAGPIAVVNLCDQQMMTAWGLQFLLLGVNDTGSRAVGDVQESFFRRQAVNGLDLVASVIGGTPGPGRGLVGRLMRWNFPALPQDEWPRLEHRGLDPGPLLEFLGLLPALAQANVVTRTNALENAILDAFKQAPLPQAFERSPQQRETASSPLAAAAQMFADAQDAKRLRTL